jgi:hypothetical protein
MVLIGKRHPQQAEIKEQVQRLMAKYHCNLMK